MAYSPYNKMIYLYLIEVHQQTAINVNKINSIKLSLRSNKITRQPNPSSKTHYINDVDNFSYSFVFIETIAQVSTESELTFFFTSIPNWVRNYAMDINQRCYKNKIPCLDRKNLPNLFDCHIIILNWFLLLYRQLILIISLEWCYLTAIMIMKRDTTILGNDFIIFFYFHSGSSLRLLRQTIFDALLHTGKCWNCARLELKCFNSFP